PRPARSLLRERARAHRLHRASQRRAGRRVPHPRQRPRRQPHHRPDPARRPRRGPRLGRQTPRPARLRQGAVMTTPRQFQSDYYGRKVQIGVGDLVVTLPYQYLREALTDIQRGVYDVLTIGQSTRLDESDLTEAVSIADARRAKWLDNIQENVKGEF